MQAADCRTVHSQAIISIDLPHNMKHFLLIPFLLITVILLNSCEGLIEYSPYDKSNKEKALNMVSIGRITTQIQSKDTLKIALISDPHTCYDELESAISCINNQQDIRFVVCCGDVTDCGLSQEYEWYQESIRHSRYPVITVIGNHDHRSNGEKIYSSMFGPCNSSFICDGYHFILFDDVVWENNNESPDFTWLDNELKSCDDPSVLLTHIPPWTDQLEGDYSNTFGNIITDDDVILCIHGHEHHSVSSSFHGVPAYVIGSIERHKVSILKIAGNECEIESIDF